ncbi:hypothetical protein BJX65DRAFT_291832, partial [Aspergillus insuetus]
TLIVTRRRPCVLHGSLIALLPLQELAKRLTGFNGSVAGAQPPKPINLQIGTGCQPQAALFLMLALPAWLPRINGAGYNHAI